MKIHFPSANRNWSYLRDILDTDPDLKDQLPLPTGFRCEVLLKGGPSVEALAIGDHIFVRALGNGGWHTHPVVKTVEYTKPFITVEVLGPACTKNIKSTVYRNFKHEVLVPHTYDSGYSKVPGVSGAPSDRFRKDEKIPYAYLTIKITTEDGTTDTQELFFQQPSQGAARLAKDQENGTVTIESEFYGLRWTWEESLEFKMVSRQSHDYWRTSRTITEKTFNPLGTLLVHTHGSVLTESVDEWWERFFRFNPIGEYKDKYSGNVLTYSLDTSGVSAVMKKKVIKENLDKLKTDCPLDFTFFLWLMNGKAVDKRKNNSMLAAMLKKVGHDFGMLRDTLRNTRLNVIPNSYGYSNYGDKAKGPWFDARREYCLQMPGVKDLIQEQDAKADWTKRKTAAAQADGLGIDKNLYPKLHKAIEAGDIPTGIFIQPTSKEAVNIEFDLWEKALGRGWGETLSKIAKNAATRSTYERDITPFLSFCFKIEKYLKKHTKKTWISQPSFVESQWQLEMDEDDNENGTVKRRSALTPVADNENLTVTVPYVALAVSGVRTQWCYSRFYHLFEEGFTDPISGGIITKDFEPKLNGRDDYGLCYYTLTGTNTARGYPTFLIIFERLDDGPRVHFHRVRPQRSKNGVTTPGSRLIEACYQYMAGNIPAKDITAQQGDLIFLALNHNPLEKKAKAELLMEGQAIDFESHSIQGRSSGSMVLYESKAKTPQNRLGFLNAKTGFKVVHPEHQDVIGMAEGWWEIRRCKSWEANPKAIWSRTID